MAQPLSALDLSAKVAAPITGEELLALADLGPCELIDGRIVAMSPTGRRHAITEVNLLTELNLWARNTKLGVVMGGEIGLFIRRDPDTVRAADALYISHARLGTTESSAFLDVAPELAAEILSPSDRWTEVMAKLADYFEVGVERVWLLDPETRRVFAYRSSTEVRIFSATEDLRDEEILPGFRTQVGALFGE